MNRLLLALISVGAFAGPIQYTFNLNGSPAGSFVYDAQAAVGSQFSAFSVTANGFTFNFTGAANTGPNFDNSAPNPCGTTIDSAASFALLNGTLCGSGATNPFSVTLLLSFVTLNLDIQLGSEVRRLSTSTNTGTSIGPLIPTVIGSGTFSITSNDPVIPEPSTHFLIISAGLVGFTITRKRR